MSERRRTVFADILQRPPQEQVAVEETVEAPRPIATKRSTNKATDPAYTKLTAYIPRTLHSALKMAMALESTTDQSLYLEGALTEWLLSKGREDVLRQCRYSAAVSQHSG